MTPLDLLIADLRQVSPQDAATIESKRAELEEVRKLYQTSAGAAVEDRQAALIVRAAQKAGKAE